MNQAEYIDLLERVREYDFWPISYNKEVIRVEWEKGFHLSSSVFKEKSGIPKNIQLFVNSFRSKNQRLWIGVCDREVFLTQKFTYFGDFEDFQIVLDHFYEEILRWRQFFDDLSHRDLVFISKK